MHTIDALRLKLYRDLGDREGHFWLGGYFQSKFFKLHDKLWPEPNPNEIWDDLDWRVV